MGMLPIVERELRVGARNPVLFRDRIKMPLVGAVILLILMWITRHGMPIQAIAKPMFNFCFYGLFASSLMAGIHFTADAISSEKREGTLGFLFLTDLRGYDVIFGKLASSSIAGIYSSMGMMPLISIIFLFGGVEWEQVLRLVLTCGNTLFFSLSAGLLASVLAMEEKRARTTALAFILGITAAGPVTGLAMFWFQNGWNQGITLAFWHPYLLCSPAGAFTSSISSLLGLGWSSCLVSNGIVHLIAWFFLLLSCWLVTRTWQEKGVIVAAAGVPERWKNWLAGSQVKYTQRRLAMLERNAVYWLTFRERSKAWSIWIGLAFVIAVFISLEWYFGENMLQIQTAVFFVLVTNTVLKLSMIAEAGRWIARDRQSGVLELILTTRIRVEDILAGQWLSLRQLYRWPFIVCGSFQTIYVFRCLLHGSYPEFSAVRILAGAGFLAVSLLIMSADFVAIGWVGMWHALSVTPIVKARPQTSNCLLVMPWVFFYLVMIGVSWLFGSGSFMFGLILWPALMIGISVWWIQRAERKLMAEFRLRAMERYSALPAHPWWAKAGRFVALYCHRIGRLKR